MVAAAPRVAVATVAATAAIALDAGDAWLTDDERVRLAAMGSAQRRAQFLAGHWLARSFAGRVLRIEVDGCTLVRADDGSPRLRVDGRAADWHVSLTHSGDRVACALAPSPVGVDLEMPRRGRDRDLAGLAAFAFSAVEARWLKGLPDAERGEAFHRIWSLKEARGKRGGEGLLPRRARRFTATRATAAEAEAATWPVDAGTLSLVCADVAAAVVEGLPPHATPSWWRFDDVAGDEPD